MRTAVNFSRNRNSLRGSFDLSSRLFTFPSGSLDKNDLQRFFDENREGAGIWKWEHYFDIYDRHLRKFRKKSVRLVEIGIYSGGSLNMWQHYLGSQAEIIGVDIEPACKRYERPGVKVLIGDQADRNFWAQFRDTIPTFDVLIDDGGHKPHQQLVTMEELIPHMNPGGVYICEDVHGIKNEFFQHICALAAELNAMANFREVHSDPERRLAVSPTSVQALIQTLALYPFVVVIELRNSKLTELVAPKRGTQWEPFLD